MDDASGENQGHSMATRQDNDDNQAKHTSDEGRGITGAA
jgi:hypothetical protein